MKKTERAYLAGFVDGEGCFSQYSSRRSGYNARFSVSQKDPKYLAWLKEELGYGCLRQSGECYRFYISRRKDLRGFILLIYPYLQLKAPQAELAYEMTYMTIAQREEAMVRLRAMKVVENQAGNN